MRFTFTGDLSLNSMESKNPYTRTGTCKNGKPWKSFGCAIASSTSNRAYLELMGVVQDSIKTYDTEKNKIEIAWEDREDADVIKSVASYMKHVAKIDDERYEFLTDYDFVSFLAEKAANNELNGRFTVTGQVKTDVYNGKILYKFQIQNIYEVEEDAKCQLKVTTEYFFNKECFDTADWTSEHKLTINGYISSYIATEKSQKYVPLSIVFDCSKIDWENPKHVALVNYKLKMIGCELVDGKVKCKLKGTGYYSMALILSYVNGAEKVEFTEDMLTETQKEAIELGLKKLEDFRPAGSIYGERVTIYKLVDFDLNVIGKNDYSDGLIDLKVSASDFEDEIFVPSTEETVEEAIEKQIAKKEETKTEDEDDDDDLFS